MRALVLAYPSQSALDAIGFAQRASEQVSITVLTTRGGEKYPYRGVEKVIVANVEDPTPDQLAGLLEKTFSSYDIVVAPSSKDSTDALARLSALKNLPMFTEVNHLEPSGDGLVVTRPVIAGRAYVTYSTRVPAAFTVAKKAFPPQSADHEPDVEEIEAPPASMVRVGVEEKKFSGVNIEDAEVVIGVGRGFRKKEDIAMAEELARLLNGAVGCSRPITADLGWLPEDAWIGISGKRIRPKLYMPIGISGAPQHMSAAIDSKLIIAVNKDKSAPVFQYSDYGFVIDLYKLLPALIEKLKQRKRT